MAKSPNEVPRSNKAAFEIRVQVLQALLELMDKCSATEDDVQRALHAIRVMMDKKQPEPAKGGFRN